MRGTFVNDMIACVIDCDTECGCFDDLSSTTTRVTRANSVQLGTVNSPIFFGLTVLSTSGSASDCCSARFHGLQGRMSPMGWCQLEFNSSWEGWNANSAKSVPLGPVILWVLP